MSELPPQILSQALNETTEAIAVCDPARWHVVFANRAFRELTAARSPAADSPVFEWLPDLAASRPGLDQVASGQTDSATLTFCAAANVRAKRLGPYVAIFIQPAADRRVDPLTGLADRGYFFERLALLLGGDRASDHRCAVLFVDVDGFKQVNDDFGHLVGDQVLGEVARRLSSCVRAADLVARFGGDEFVVLLEAARGRVEIAPVAERIRVAFDRPIALPQGEVKLAVSVGAAEAGPHDRSAEALVDAADRAMYAAKRAPL